MSEIIKTNTEYSKWIKEVSFKVSQQPDKKLQQKLIEKCYHLYWSIGHDISESYNEAKYEKNPFFHKNLSLDLQDALPDVKSFSVTNLKYMKYFFTTYTKKFKSSTSC